MSAFNGICDAIVDLLSAAPAVSSQVKRNVARPLAEQHTDAVVVRLIDSQAEQIAMLGAPIDWQTTLAVECYAKSATLSADEAVDTLLAAVYGKLATNPTLSRDDVLDLKVQGIEWTQDATDRQLGCATVTYAVLHRTSAHTLT